MKYPFASHLIRELAPEIGATVWLDPEYEFVGEITFANGTRHLFRNTNFNINPLGSVEIVRDKGYACMFLQRYGFPVVEGITLLSPRLNANVILQKTVEDGEKFLDKAGFPAIIKPNNRSQGLGVSRIDSHQEYRERLEELFETTQVVRLERLHQGRDYRVVVLDDEVISAYERVPLNVTGDGILSIAALLSQKQLQFETDGRDTIIDLDDCRMKDKLSKSGYSLSSVLSQGERVFLLDNANLSSGGDACDITTSIHPDFIQFAIDATRSLGLRLSGVDILADDLTKPRSQNHYLAIIELNGAPGLDNYMSSGDEQRENVKDLYRKILRVLEGNSPL